MSHLCSRVPEARRRTTEHHRPLQRLRRPHDPACGRQSPRTGTRRQGSSSSSMRSTANRSTPDGPMTTGSSRLSRSRTARSRAGATTSTRLPSSRQGDGPPGQGERRSRQRGLAARSSPGPPKAADWADSQQLVPSGVARLVRCERRLARIDRPFCSRDSAFKPATTPSRPGCAGKARRTENSLIAATFSNRGDRI